MSDHCILILDLDGPILDVSGRYHRVYADSLSELNRPALDRQSYWNLKRDRVPEEQILARTHADDLFSRYNRLRLRRIESDTYLRLDALVPGALETLDAVRRRGWQLVLATLRTRSDMLERQLDRLGLARRLFRTFSGRAKEGPRWKTKRDWLSSGGLLSRNTRSLFVGDTETDVRAGRSLGITTVAVANGIRSRPLLEAVGPDHLVPDITHVLPLIDGIGPIG